MTSAGAAVLRPGDWVHYDDAQHQVVGLAGTTMRLRSHAGDEQVVLATHLMGSVGFEVTGHDPAPQLEPFAVLDSLPPDAIATAREWERHVIEVETGLPPDAQPGALRRDGYDPATTTVGQRDAVKAAELGVSVRTVQARRARYARQGCGGWSITGQRGSGR
jgi:putative transposase